MMKGKSELPIIIVDTREQLPYKFIASKRCAGCKVETLNAGDYSIEGMQGTIVVERKKDIDELRGNLGKNRDRFERELQRMVDSGIKFKFIVVEDYYSSIWKRGFSRMNPMAVFESILALELKYDVRFIFCGTRKMGHTITRSLLLRAYDYKKKGLI
jgi:ERCC4-type nuclease